MLFTPFFRRRGTVSCPLDTGRPRRKAGRRSHGNKSLHSRHLKVEPLEQRALLAVVAWDGGGDGKGLSGLGGRLVSALPPMHELAKNVGLDLPEYLGKLAGEAAAEKPRKQPPAPAADA